MAFHGVSKNIAYMPVYAPYMLRICSVYAPYIPVYAYQVCPVYARICTYMHVYALKGLPVYARICPYMPVYARICTFFPVYAPYMTRIWPVYAPYITIWFWCFFSFSLPRFFLGYFLTLLPYKEKRTYGTWSWKDALGWHPARGAAVIDAIRCICCHGFFFPRSV